MGVSRVDRQSADRVKTHMSYGGFILALGRGRLICKARGPGGRVGDKSYEGFSFVCVCVYVKCVFVLSGLGDARAFWG